MGRVMLVFPQPVIGEDVNSKDEEDQEVRDQNRTQEVNVSEGWNIVGSRKNKYAGGDRNGARRDIRAYDNIVRGNKTWVSKADLVSKWRPNCNMSSSAIS